MTRSEFDSLTMFEKADIVFQKETYLNTREYYNQNINLYLVNDLYVEVWYKPGENQISEIKTAKAKGLSLYKTPVNLNTLLEE